MAPMLWALLLLVVPALSRVSVGGMQKKSFQWVLLDKFAFDTTEGVLEISSVKQNAQFPNQIIAVYHDIDFPLLYKSEYSCAYKLSKAAKQYNISTNAYIGNPLHKGVTIRTKSIIPRWWYVVVVNCDVGVNKFDQKVNTVEGVGLNNFKFVWKNGDSHFSYDQMGIGGMVDLSIFVLLALIVVAGRCYYVLKKTEGDLGHHVMLVLMITMIFHLLAVLCRMSHRSKFAQNGRGRRGFLDAAVVLDEVPELMLVALFMCVAKGLYITEQSLRDNRSVIEVMCVYSVLTVALLYYANNYDFGYQVFFFETRAGKLLVGLRLITTFWFFSSLRATWKLEPYRRTFYSFFALLGGLWFLSYPISVEFAVNNAGYNRVKIVYFIKEIIAFVVYAGWIAAFGRERGYIRKAGASAKHEQLGHGDGFSDINMIGMNKEPRDSEGVVV